MVGRRSAIIGITTRDDPDRLFDRSVDVDLLHIVKLETIETVSVRARGPSLGGMAALLWALYFGLVHSHHLCW